jgi:YidC/Oxa1 family membrane protein insertase
MFEGFFDLVGSILNFFYTLIPNYGIAIMLLTVLVMVLITPLTVKSTKSMLQMQRLQPEMKRLQTKYKDDREKLNEELMKFYRENQINPLGGCLPILAQMPVFIIMYQLLRGLTNRVGGTGSGVGQIAGEFQRSVQLTPWVYEDQNFRPLHLNPGTKLYDALSNTNDMNFLGMDLALSASQALKASLVIALPYFFLLLVMLVTGVYQNRQLQARNKSAATNPQQQMIMKIMPFFLPIFSFGFPAGLALYWCTQNFCRIGTNAYITRSVYGSDDDGGSTDRPAKQAGKQVGKGSDEGGSGSSSDSKASKSKSGSRNGTAPESAKPKPKSPSSSKRVQGGGSRPAGRKSGSGSGRRSGEPRKSGE